MNVPVSLDALSVARKVVNEAVATHGVPRSAFTVSIQGITAVCKALVEATDNPQPVISTALADAARALIAAEDEVAALPKDEDGYVPIKVGLARELAFHTFKTLFEQEFPNV